MNKKQFIKSTFIYSINAIIIAGIGFVSLPILTRLLTKEDFGIISIFNATILMLIPILGSNSNMVFVQQYFKIDDSERSKLISSILSLTLISLLLFVILAPVVLIWKNVLGIPSLAFALALICASFLIFNSTLNSFWQVINDAKSYLFYNSSKALFIFLFTVGFLLIFNSGWIVNVLVVFVLEIIYFLVSVNYLRTRYKLNFKDTSYFKTIFKIGLPYLPSSFGSWIFKMGDRYIIIYLLGLPAVGLYEIANKVGGSIRIIDTSISRTWGAFFYQRINKTINQSNEIKNILKTLLLISALLTALSSLYFLGGKLLLKLLVSQEFQVAYGLIGWFAINYVLYGTFEKLNNFIINTGRTYISSFVIITLGLGKVVLTYYMIKAYGLQGALYGSFVINIVLIIVTVLVVLNLDEYKESLSISHIKNIFK